MKRFIRKLLRGSSLATALFIFEACYGTCYTELPEMDCYSFSVVSEDGLTPLSGVKIFSRPYKSDFLDWNERNFTGEEGTADVLVESVSGQHPQFLFKVDDGSYIEKDTVILKKTDERILIKLEKKVE